MHNFKNIFLRKIFLNKDNNALIYENIIYTYSQLSENVLKNINLLNSTTANIIGIIGDYDFESISLLLACIELNKIIIPFVDEKEIENKLKEVRCDLVFNNGEIILKNDGSVNHPLVDRLIKENKSGLILFSSGSTGKPKAIIHDLYKIIQNIQFDNKHNIVISLFLPDHVAGIDVLLKTLSSNSTLVIVSKREVGVILKSIELYKVNIMPISPSMLRLILLGEVDKYNLESIEVIAYGSEKIDESILNKIKKLFKNSYIKQNFGTSETFSFKTKNNKNNETYFKILDAKYKIIEGELYLKSNTQSLGYLNADNSVFTDDGYFATGDLVEVINENGEEYIKIIGRNKEIINVGGEKVLPQEVEGIIFQIPFIQDCLVYGQSNPLTGQSVCLKVVLTKEKNINSLELKKEIRLFYKDKLASYKIPTKVDIVESLEVSKRFKKARK